MSTPDPSNTTIEHPVVGATSARQGRWGRHAFWVLVFSTLLAAIGLFAAWTWRSGDLASANSDNGGMKPSARMFNAPEPAAVTPTPQQSATPGPATSNVPAGQ